MHCIIVCIQILNSFMTLTWCIFGAKRKQQFVLAFSINLLLLMISFVVSMVVTSGHASRLGCASATHALTVTDPHQYCGWQGAFMHILSLSVTAWWAYVHRTHLRMYLTHACMHTATYMCACVYATRAELITHLSHPLSLRLSLPLSLCLVHLSV
jgi:hypothetical protein